MLRPLGIAIALLRWFGAPRSRMDQSADYARTILDERHARREIDRDEDMTRRQGIASRPIAAQNSDEEAPSGIGSNSSAGFRAIACGPYHARRDGNLQSAR